MLIYCGKLRKYDRVNPIAFLRVLLLLWFGGGSIFGSLPLFRCVCLSAFLCVCVSVVYVHMCAATHA